MQEPDPDKTYYCSFCGKSNKEVEKMLVHSPGKELLAICNECHDRCDEIMKDN